MVGSSHSKNIDHLILYAVKFFVITSTSILDTHNFPHKTFLLGVMEFLYVSMYLFQIVASCWHFPSVINPTYGSLLRTMERFFSFLLFKGNKFIGIFDVDR